MTSELISQRSGAISKLMEARLGIRGRGLQAKLRKSRRVMPNWVRQHAQELADAELLLSHPKLMRQADTARLEKSYKKCESYLKSIDPAARYKAWWLTFLANNAFNLLIVAAIVLLALAVGGFV